MPAQHPVKPLSALNLAIKLALDHELLVDSQTFLKQLIVLDLARSRWP